MYVRHQCVPPLSMNTFSSPDTHTWYTPRYLHLCLATVYSNRCKHSSKHSPVPTAVSWPKTNVVGLTFFLGLSYVYMYVWLQCSLQPGPGMTLVFFPTSTSQHPDRVGPYESVPATAPTTSLGPPALGEMEITLTDEILYTKKSTIQWYCLRGDPPPSQQ